MSEVSGHIDATTGSPTYTGAEFALFVNLLARDVIPGIENELEPSAGVGLEVIIDSGAMISKGYYYNQNEAADGGSELSFALDAEGAGSNRIDRLYIDFDLTKADNIAVATVLKGTATTGSPTAPTLPATASHWGEPIAQCLVQAGSLISVTDERTIAGGRYVIGAGAVIESMIAALAVTEGKIGAAAVTESKIGTGAVTVNKIGALAVTTAKIAADAVDGTKIADDAVNSEHIADGAIDLAHMSANSVDSAQYVDGSIDAVHLGTIGEITMASGDTISWSDNGLYLNVNGCTSVRLVPVIFGTSSSAPSGTYPKGTLYLTYEA